VNVVFNICCCVAGGGGGGGEGQLVEVSLTVSKEDLLRLCTALQNEFSDDSPKSSLKYISKVSSIKEILSSVTGVVHPHSSNTTFRLPQIPRADFCRRNLIGPVVWMAAQSAVMA